MALGDRLDRFRSRGVNEPYQPEQRHLPLDIGAIEHRVRLGHGAHRNRDDTLAIRRQTLHHVVPVVSLERLIAARRGALMHAHRQNRLGRTLHEDAGVPVVVMVQHGHIPVCSVERNDISTLPV